MIGDGENVKKWLEMWRRSLEDEGIKVSLKKTDGNAET